MAADVRAAPAYELVSDLWLVTSYFNPLRYRTRRRNYRQFRRRIEAAGLPLLTIECAFGEMRFELPAAADTLQVRTRDVLWLKERLLNLAIARLPAGCTKVAWVDADVLFENPAWARETSRLLDSHPVVQPFDRAIRLPRDGRSARGASLPGFAAVWNADPAALSCGYYDAHGHTGLAWAARRDLLARRRLYDACIIGGGDHVMAHALCGDLASPCLDLLIGPDNAHRTHYAAWAEPVAAEVLGRIGYVPGAALHLWHGEHADRRYVDRHRDLMAFGFDPATDLREGPSGCWEWQVERTEVRDRVLAHLERRHEDGPPPPIAAADEQADVAAP